MANIWANMDVVPYNLDNPQKVAFECKESLAGAANGTWFIVPDEVAGISVTVIAAGGATGNIQTCTERLGDLKAGDTLNPVDWDLGANTGTKQDYCFPCTAFRVVQANAGTVKMFARAQ